MNRDEHRGVVKAVLIDEVEALECLPHLKQKDNQTKVLIVSSGGTSRHALKIAEMLKEIDIVEVEVLTDAVSPIEVRLDSHQIHSLAKEAGRLGESLSGGHRGKHRTHRNKYGYRYG